MRTKIIVESNVYGLKGLYDLFEEMRNTPIIKTFMDSHELTNRAITDNEVYTIEFLSHGKTIVYLNQEI